MNQSTDNVEVSKDEDEAFMCGVCRKMFISLDFLRSHIEKSHVNQKISNEEEVSSAENSSNIGGGEKYDKIICNINGCDKVFEGKAKKPQYKRHLERVYLFYFLIS